MDFDRTFAPGCEIRARVYQESVRLLLALVAQVGMADPSHDVESSFLNDELEEVYVAQPAGFIVAGEEHKVLRL